MKHKIDSKYIYSGITAIIVICVGLLFKYAIDDWEDIKAWLHTINIMLTPLITGFILAYLLNPVLNFFEYKIFEPIGKKLIKTEKAKKKYKKLSRAVSIILAQAIFICFLMGFLWVVIPNVYKSIESIAIDLPKYVKQFINWIQNFKVGNKQVDGAIVKVVTEAYAYASNILNDRILPNLDTIIINISSGVVGGVKLILNLVIGFIVSIYVMANKDLFRAQSKKLIYCVFDLKQGNAIIDGAAYAHKVVGGFFSGKIIDSIIIGLICFTFMRIAKLDYAVLISVIIGLTNIIPFFGPFIGAVPCALLLLMVDPWQCLIFIIFILVLQQVDGNILGPLILGDSIGISGFWVLTAILIGQGLFGFVGLILGVPIFACIYALIKIICEKILVKKDMPVETKDYSIIKKFNTESKTPIYSEDKWSVIDDEECENEDNKE